MKTILCFILILSTELCSAQFTAAQQQELQTEQAEQQQEGRLAAGILIGATAAITTVAVIFFSKAHKHSVAEEAKFQACVGKSKSEIYTIYGPPNSIVDDAQGQGGTILEYQTVITSGGGETPVSTITNRKMFYLNKDNVVTSVKEDNH